jgi:phage regulator Rha-like protein
MSDSTHDLHRTIINSITDGLNDLASNSMSSVDMTAFKDSLRVAGVEVQDTWFRETRDGYGATAEGFTEMIKAIKNSTLKDEEKEEAVA